MTLRKLHGVSAVVLAAFAALHLTNHLVGLAGIQAHLDFMQSFRAVYRHPAIEAVLLAAVALQIYSGLHFVLRGWKQRRGLIAWLQAGSGAYLAFFLLNHVGAVLLGRTVLNLDTNFYFAAAGLHVPPLAFFFAPYYFLAVLALFTHLGCAWYWHWPTQSILARNAAVILLAGVGLVVALLVVLMLAGVFYPVDIPPEYQTTFRLP